MRDRSDNKATMLVLTMATRRKTRVAKSAQKMETQGILLIVLVILIYALARYWHNIPWGLR